MVVFLLMVTGMSNSLAGISAPASYAILSGDGKHVLVMRSKVVNYDKRFPVKFTLPNGRLVIIHETFPKSGCYDSTSLAPFWQVDWYALAYTLRWSPDFGDVVRLNPWALKSDWALEFYHEGHLAHRYDSTDLLTGLRHPAFFPLSTWDWYAKWYDSFEVHGNRLNLSTMPRQINLPGGKIDLGVSESYVFDLSSGMMISRSLSDAVYLWLYGIVGTTVLCVLSFAIWLLYKRVRCPHEEFRPS